MSGAINDIICLDDDAVVSHPISTTSTPARSPLTLALSHMEMDPCNQDKWLDRCLAKTRDGDIRTVLESFKSEDKDQIGGFIHMPVTQELFISTVAPPQAGKTQGILLASVEAAYDSGILTVMGVMNSVLETGRFRDTAKKLNGILSKVAGALGIQPGNAPQLKIFDEGSVLTYRQALTAWAGGSNVIPVFVVMMNNTKFNKFQANHLPFLTNAVGRDRSGRPKTMLVVDEADLQYKTENNTSQLEKSIFGQKFTIGAERFATLQDAFTTIMNVTATPQALAMGDVRFGGRTPVVYEPQPSKNNFQYHSKDGWNNKIVTRRIADSVNEMYKNMMDDEVNRSALIYEAGNCKIAGRSSAALSTAKRLAGNEGLITFAWSSNKIESFTSDPFWLDIFETAPPGVFTRKQESEGVSKFVGTKSVRSYPDVISYLAQRVGSGSTSAKYKFVLFACEMAARAVPIKGRGHEWCLTDMWIDAPNMPQEARIQVCGRLCGIDLEGEIKTLWCTEEEHEAHKKAIDTVQYIIDKLLKVGIGARDAIAKTNKTLVDLTDDVPVVSKIVVDEDGAIGHLGGTKICRPTAMKRVRESAVDVKRLAKSKKMKLTTEEYASGISHAETDSSADDASTPRPSTPSSPSDSTFSSSTSDGPLVDPNTLAQMREAADGESGDGVAEAIKEVIRDNGGSVESARVPMDMASRDSYPDGTSFSPSAFLKFVISERMDLLGKNGIQYRHGVFSEV